MLLEIRNAQKTYRGNNGPVVAIDNVSLNVDAGEFVAVAGPSGCGKTTLLLVAGGLLSPDGGEVSVVGQNPYALPSEARAKLRAENIGFVFQQFHLIPYLSVLENVTAAALPTGLPNAAGRAKELITQFALDHRMHHLPGQLSTGERQRTALARALLNSPRLLLADEPTGNLDHENAQIVLEHLTTFARNEGAVLLVTHDNQALEYADRIENIRDGALLPQKN